MARRRRGLRYVRWYAGAQRDRRRHHRRAPRRVARSPVPRPRFEHGREDRGAGEAAGLSRRKRGVRALRGGSREPQGAARFDGSFLFGHRSRAPFYFEARGPTVKGAHEEHSCDGLGLRVLARFACRMHGVVELQWRSAHPHSSRGRHRVTSNLRVLANVTVEACARVEVGAGFQIQVGGTTPGKLVTRGTNAGSLRPVIFTAADAVNPWSSVVVDVNGAADLAYTVLSSGDVANRQQNGGGILRAFGASSASTKAAPTIQRSVRADGLLLEASAGPGANMRDYAGFTEDSTGLAVRSAPRRRSPRSSSSRATRVTQSCSKSRREEPSRPRSRSEARPTPSTAASSSSRSMMATPSP